jgi:hypothetical protein
MVAPGGRFRHDADVGTSMRAVVPVFALVVGCKAATPAPSTTPEPSSEPVAAPEADAGGYDCNDHDECPTIDVDTECYTWCMDAMTEEGTEGTDARLRCEQDCASSADVWTCYERPGDGWMESMCYETGGRCDAARAGDATPDITACSPAGVLYCFTGDILYQDGSVAVTAAPYCFLAADECEVIREVALDDPESARIGDCAQM